MHTNHNKMKVMIWIFYIFCESLLQPQCFEPNNVEVLPRLLADAEEALADRENNKNTENIPSVVVAVDGSANPFAMTGDLGRSYKAKKEEKI